MSSKRTSIIHVDSRIAGNPKISLGILKEARNIIGKEAIQYRVGLERKDLCGAVQACSVEERKEKMYGKDWTPGLHGHDVPVNVELGAEKTQL